MKPRITNTHILDTCQINADGGLLPRVPFWIVNLQDSDAQRVIEILTYLGVGKPFIRTTESVNGNAQNSVVITGSEIPVPASQKYCTIRILKGDNSTPSKSESEFSIYENELSELTLLREITLAWNQAQQSATALDELKNTILDDLEKAVCLIAPGGEVIYLNREWQNLSKYEPDHCLLSLKHGDNIHTFCKKTGEDHETQKAQILDSISKIQDGVISSSEQIYMCKENEFKNYYTVRIRRIGKLPGYAYLSAQDITERIENKQRATKSENRFNIASSLSSEIIWEWDLNTGLVISNRLHGHSASKEEHCLTFLEWISRIHPEDRGSFLDSLGLGMKSNENSWNLTYRIMLENGEIAHVRDRATFETDEEGGKVRLIGTMRDITKAVQRGRNRQFRKQCTETFFKYDEINDALFEILEHLKSHCGACAGEAWIPDMDDNKVLLQVQNFEDMNHYDPFVQSGHKISSFKSGEGLPGIAFKTGKSFFTPSLRECQDFLRQNFLNESDLKSAATIPVKLGDSVVAVFMVLFESDPPQFPCIKDVAKDLSSAVASELERKKEKKYIRRFLDTSPDFHCTLNLKGEIKYLNHRLEEELHISEDAINYGKFLQFVNSEDQDRVSIHLYEMVRKSLKFSDFVCRCSFPGKKEQWISWNMSMDPEYQTIYASGRNITSQKALEMEKSNILESIADGFFNVDKDCIVKYWNNTAEKLLETSRKKILGKSLWSITKGREVDKTFNKLKEALEQHRDESFEYYHEGLNKTFIISCYPDREGMSVFFKDITQLKRKKEEIEQLKLNREAMLNTTDSLIWSVDREYRLIAANEAFKTNFCNLLGRPVEEGENILPDELPNEMKEFWSKAYQKAFSGEELKMTYKAEIDGKDQYILVSVKPIKVEYELTGLACFAQNVTELMQHTKMIERQNRILKDITWMQSHEVRGPLARIMGLVDILKQTDAEDGSEIYPMMDKACKELDQVIHKIVEKSENVEDMTITG